MSQLQANFLFLGIGLLFIKLCFLILVLVIATQIGKRAKALKEKQLASQLAASSITPDDSAENAEPTGEAT